MKDPIGRTGWPKEKGRDGERTPMQWDETSNAGFSTAKPWLPVPPTAKTHNVADESTDLDSVLNFYKKVLKLRHTNKALLDGSYTALNQNDQNVLSYLRVYKDQAVLVVQRTGIDVQCVQAHQCAADQARTELSWAGCSPRKIVNGW